MKICFKNFDRILNVKRSTFSAVILAAGEASRFGGDKIGARVNGTPVLAMTLAAFENCPLIDEIVLVLPKEDFKSHKADAAALLTPKVRRVVKGGDTRQESALSGLEACAPETDYIAIHDAARCLVTPEMIAEVCRAAEKHRAAAAASRVVDTVKLADEKGFIEQTVDREKVWLVSTPQIFNADMYRAAAYTARDSGFEATDDCSLAERLGFKIKLVDVGSENIKITYREDIARAEDILRRREVENEGEMST